VSIGEDLAQARCRAGLSVAEVSQRTCIRETLIRAIEHDDYCGCGGDFYARGHIRAIARAVGADPVPLIAEYDAAHRPPQPVTAADLAQPVRPVRIRERHRLNWAAVLGLALLAVAGLAAYHLLVAAHHPAAVHAAAGSGPPAASHRHGHRAAAAPAPAATTPAPVPYAHTVAIRLRAVEDCWVEFTTPGGRYLFQLVVAGGTAQRWVFRHAVDMRLGNPGGVSLRVDGRNPLPPGTAQPITLRLGPGGKIST
jgi:cytoskeletal protein RodZ